MMEMFYRDKKVLVTGAAGFIGSHLVERLAGLEGCKVRAFVRYNSRNSWGWLEGAGRRGEVSVHAGDLRDYDSVSAAMEGVDVVFHLGALIGIPYSYVSPMAYIKTNVEGTYNVVQAARRLGVGRVVVTSTSEVYGTARSVPIGEEHPLQPQSPYSASKISADNLALSYHLSFDLPLVIARPFNTYGPRQSARAIIPTVITQILSGAREIKLGSLHPTRDMNFVADTVEGFLHLAASEAAVGRAVNICSGAEVSMGELVGTLKEILGSECALVSEDDRIRPPKSEVERLLGDATLLRKLTGWSPASSLRQGLASTVEWFREPENLRHYKADIYNI